MGTITKIHNKEGTAYRAQVRKFDKGKIIYSKAATFPTRAKARGWMEDLEEALAQPNALQRAVSAAVTVGDLIDCYLEDFCQEAGRTKKMDIKHLRKYPFTKLPAADLTTDVLVKHIAERRKTVEPQTAQNDLIWLRNIFKAAKPAWGIPIDASEVEAAIVFCRKKGMVARPNRRERRPTAAELEKLSNHFRSRDERADIPMYDIMWFAIYSSRRQAEITGLRWDDNDKKHLTGLVRDIKHPRKKGINKRFKYTNAAWDIVERQPKTDSPFIFPYQSKSVGAAFTRACHLLGIEDLRFHDLRHEGTSRLFEAGYSIPEVQLFTLHESWEVLRRYVNLRPESVALR